MSKCEYCGEINPPFGHGHGGGGGQPPSLRDQIAVEYGLDFGSSVAFIIRRDGELVALLTYEQVAAAMSVADEFRSRKPKPK